jgi:hypothetical protein
MRATLAIAGAALIAGAGLARASECGEQIRLLDDRYSLAVVQSGEVHPDGQRPAGADQTAASGASGGPTTSAGLDSVPNTGGVANPRNTPIEPLDAAQRERVRDALIAAKRADAAGDGTTCAAKVAEARRLVHGEPAGPRAQ